MEGHSPLGPAFGKLFRCQSNQHLLVKKCVRGGGAPSDPHLCFHQPPCCIGTVHSVSMRLSPFSVLQLRMVGPTQESALCTCLTLGYYKTPEEIAYEDRGSWPVKALKLMCTGHKWHLQFKTSLS